MTSIVKTIAQSALATCALCVAVSFAQPQPQQQPYYTGDGGKSIRLAVLEPVGKGLSADEQWMLSLVQGSITGDLNKYSAMTIIDRQNLEKIFAEWKESMSGNYSDADRVKIGNLTNASHILTGSISKTASAFMLELTVTDVASGVRKASYSPTPVSLLALEDLSAIKAASADLLRQLGVSLTDEARAELTRAANTARIQAETMLARGITAQKQGTEVAALSYFYQAAAFDPSLVEASSRSSIMFANISSGNIGADTRNDIAWRKSWIARLKETEETFYKIINASDAPPYTLRYSTNIRKGNINYQEETIDLSIGIMLTANIEWFSAMDRALGAANAVLDGLNATKRKNDWELNGWPWNGVSDVNPFRPYSSAKQYEISVVFELVNDRGRTIGNRTVELNPSFRISVNREAFSTEFTKTTQETVSFNGVKADDISDNLTIRVASVNGAPPQKARFTVSAISGKQQQLVDDRDGKKYNTVKIGDKTWMAENLKYQPPTSTTWCYDNKDSNCDKYGRLYSWGLANTICPTGWHLPTRQEWNDLIEEAGGSYAGKNLRSVVYRDGNDMFGFSALPGGYVYTTEQFRNIDRDGYWWTATAASNGNAYRKHINYSDEVNESTEKTVYGLSVRCVQGTVFNPTEMETGYAPTSEPTSAPASAPISAPAYEWSSKPAPPSKRVSVADTPEPVHLSARQLSPSAASYLRVNGGSSDVTVSFDAVGGTKTLTVGTDGGDYDITFLPERCSVRKYGDSFSLTCGPKNNEALSNNDWFNVTSGDKTVKVTIAQSASGGVASHSSAGSRSNESHSKRGMGKTAGFGGFFASDFGGGISWTDTSGNEGELVMPFYGGGFHVFMGSGYFDFMMSFTVGGGRWASSEPADTNNQITMSHAYMGLGVFGKFPVIGSSRVAFFPLYGIEYAFAWLGADSTNNKTTTIKYADGSREDYSFDGKDGHPSIKSLSALWGKFGIGVKIGTEFYTRIDALYAIRLMPTKFEDDFAKRETRDGRTAKPIPGRGLTVRIGIGYGE